MAYKVIILYQLYMPSYFLGTFTEYPQTKEGVQKGKIPPCRIGYLISVSNRDTNKSRVPNTFWTAPSFIAYQTLFRLTILLYIHLNGCRIYSCRIIKSGTTIYHMFESKLYFSLKCFFTIDNQSDFLIQID